MNYLLSYPRSGNTWLRYCIEVLTGERTIGYLNSNSFDKGIMEHNRNNKKPIIIKRHDTLDIENNEDNRLILIVRNYKEVLIRHNSNKKTIFDDYKDYTSGEPISYIKLLKYYDEFKGKKIIIYYEDIINDLKNTLNLVINFLNVEIPEEIAQEFFQNLENHKNKSLSIYENSKTNGESLIYHSLKISKEERIKWDEFLIEKENQIYNKYLKRYEENTL